MLRLHDEIPGRTRHAVIVGAVKHYRVHSAKVIVRRRRRDGPFQRGAVPRIGRGLGALDPTPYQVDQENQLYGGREIGRVGHELVHRNQFMTSAAYFTATVQLIFLVNHSSSGRTSWGTRKTCRQTFRRWPPRP